MLDRIFASFSGDSKTTSLHSLCHELFYEQKQSWPGFYAGVEALALIQVRELRCNGFHAKLQFNPSRIISSTSPVDPRSIKDRPCFLCLQNLPEEQKGVLYRNDFLILCNPYPVVKQHFTVSNVKHIPQSIAGYVTPFLQLARDISPDFNVFYNGPRSGASAPDHLHFQAMPTGSLPIEREIQQKEKLKLVKSAEGVIFYRAINIGREAIVIEGKVQKTIEAFLYKIIDRLRILTQAQDEPMMNIYCSYGKEKWRIVVFPRSKHRPDVYYKKDEERILISPGLVEMSGLVIMPVEKDFAAMDNKTLEAIYKEISLEGEMVKQVLDF